MMPLYARTAHFSSGIVLIAAVAIGACARAQSAPAISPPSPQPDTFTYAVVGADSLRTYVFRPATGRDGSPRAAVVVFHGGGWASGNASWAFARARHFASRGAVAIAVQYRLSDQRAISPIEAIADARAAIRWVRTEAGALGVDPSRVAAYGWSAGAHLAAAAAMIPDTLAAGAGGHARPTGEAMRAAPDALVLVSPAVSLANDGWFRRLLGDRASVDALDPISHVRAGLPPTLILQGDRDTVTPLSGVRAFCDRLQLAGNRCDLRVYPNVGHLFTPADRPDTGQPQPDPVVQRTAFAAADQFLQTLGYLR